VRWIGGGSGAAKTSVAAALAARFGLRGYSTDAAIPPHAAAAGPDTPLLATWLQMSMDERWLLRDPVEMVHTFPWFAGERFDRIVADLSSAPTTPLTVAEGFRLLPRLVAPLLVEPWQAIWLVPTPDFRRWVFARRPLEQQFWLRTSDPSAAFERLLARDQMFTDCVSDEAAGLGLRVVVVDASSSEAALAEEVARWFRL